MKNQLLFAFGITLLSVFLSSTSDAAVVKRVKGQSVLVDLESDTAQEGDTYYLINEEGKKKAIVKVTKVKDTQAIAKVLKGQAAEGMTLLYRPQKEKASHTSSESHGERSKAAFGGFLGFSLSNMTVKLTQNTNNPNVNMTGPSFSGHMFFDYNFVEKIGVRITGGVQQFNATGDKYCGNTLNQTCDANILYANLGFMGRFIMSSGDFRPWVGGGAGFLFPLSKTSTALASNSITNTSIGFGGAGIDWYVGPTDFIPISIEYGILPSSAEVSANLTSIRIGYGTTY